MNKIRFELRGWKRDEINLKGIFQNWSIVRK
jgi:hypothetical protein